MVQVFLVPHQLLPACDVTKHSNLWQNLCPCPRAQKTVKRGFSSKEMWVLLNLWRFLRLCKVFVRMTNFTWGVTPSCWTIYVWPCSIVIIVCFLPQRQTQHIWRLYFRACFTDKEYHHCFALNAFCLNAWITCTALLLCCFATLHV